MRVSGLAYREVDALLRDTLELLELLLRLLCRARCERTSAGNEPDGGLKADSECALWRKTDEASRARIEACMQGGLPETIRLHLGPLECVLFRTPPFSPLPYCPPCPCPPCSVPGGTASTEGI